ncbi:DUF262 domain-containing protein, partial [Campylobacter upsaliensis]|nr:DUF262 domain-containing protein [Campylobacter upsaliensis]
MSQSQYLRAIGDLKGENFVIPSYQRGYRWTSKEVTTLLQDIWDFAQMENQPDFYCLQPIVVKKNGREYNVIDGQQRLTTIFLTIKFLQNKDYFTIDYQSRLKSAEFLKNIQHNNADKDKNIDFYHFDKAYGYIKDFFENDDIDKKKFENTLIDKCKVLWYEIAKKENENEVFIRLNIGKIPLVEAENIKALFLSKNDELDGEDLKERAELWYKSEIETRENRDFRYCVLNKIDEKNIEQKNIKDDILRIDAYLKAIVPYSKEKYYLFDYFYKCYRDGTLSDRWEELEKAINTL